MATEEILKLCEALSLSEEDGPVLDIAEDVQADGIRSVEHCLVGKILSRRKVNREAFRGTIEQIWGTVGRIDIEMVGDNVFVFHFQSLEDKAMFLRIKVSIDITKPLKRGIRLRLANFDTMITALIKYERLPDFCYGCGFIGHSFRKCYNSEVRRNIMEGVEQKFGGWLRASPLDQSKFRQKGEDTSEAIPKVQEDIEHVAGVGAEDEILRLCEALSLSEEDGPVLDIAGDVQADGIRSVEHCLVGKILSRRKVNREAFRGTIEQIWGTVGRIEIEMVGNNVFVFHFQSLEDKVMNFETLITALIKYERLPDFCYGCGYIGHSVRECHNSEVRKSIMEGVEPKFGVAISSRWVGKKFLSKQWRTQKVFGSPLQPPKQPRSSPWSPPPAGSLKLNTDTAVKPGCSVMGSGAVVRDSQGKVVAASAKPLLRFFPAELGELLALREGLLLAKEFNLIIEWVELDAATVVARLMTKMSVKVLSPHYLHRCSEITSVCLVESVLYCCNFCKFKFCLPPSNSKLIINENLLSLSSQQKQRITQTLGLTTWNMEIHDPTVLPDSSGFQFLGGYRASCSNSEAAAAALHTKRVAHTSMTVNTLEVEDSNTMFRIFWLEIS
ncbi:hypothetical protein ACOSQ3_028419 [Xanthoceras sorbifolium]